MRRHLPLAPTLTGLLLLLAAAGCNAPRIDGLRTVADDAPAPVIRPLGEVLAETDLVTLEPTDTEALQARAAALQGRAGAIAASGTDPETRARLDAAIAARDG